MYSIISHYIPLLGQIMLNPHCWWIIVIIDQSIHIGTIPLIMLM